MIDHMSLTGDRHASSEYFRGVQAICKKVGTQ